MSIGITGLAILLICRGVAQTFTKDMWWSWVRFRYSIVGLKPTRTKAWENWTTVSGVIMLLAGIGLYVIVPR
jgi:hypothetical protein